MKFTASVVAKMSVALLASAPRAPAVTLDHVLQTTLEKNPTIQQAKARVEEAAGRRLVLRSIMWPDARIGIPAGAQGGARAGESGTKGFGFVRGLLTQPLFNAAIPPSRHRGDVDILIAEQQLNVTVMEQLHAARVAFYTALFNRELESIRHEQQQRLEENAASQKDRYQAGLTDRSAFTSATVEARALDAQVEDARRAYTQAQLTLAEAMAREIRAGPALPDPEGELRTTPFRIDLDSETARALEQRADLKLARLLVRAANEDQRIIEAGYYPLIAARISGDYIPVSGIHREGSSRRTDDFISSEVRIGATYTWRVIDNGKVTGAAMKQGAARDINELTCQKLEINVRAELPRIYNDFRAIDKRQESLSSASTAAQQGVELVSQNLANGLASQLEYRVSQNGLLEVKSGLLEAAYQRSLAMAEWDRATGRYFQFSDDRKVP
jgi:outer membrane protein TolC